jgi:outer membrane protein assembly factor BamE
LSSIRKLLPLFALLAGCQYVPMLPGISPYRIDIQQGNYVTQDMIDKVKPGMTKAQVRFALGTPLVVDLFHSDRWDYVYVLQKRGQLIERRRIVVVFQDDKLVRIDGTAAPASPGTTAGGESLVTGAAATPAPAKDAPSAPPAAVTGTVSDPAGTSGTGLPGLKPPQR